jgi:hypothetical protein
LSEHSSDNSDLDVDDNVHDGIASLDPGLYWEARREWSDCAGDAELAVVADDGLPVPDVETDTVTVFRDHAIATKRLARQSVIKPGTAGESFSLYCYMHKCKICKKT